MLEDKNAIKFINSSGNVYLKWYRKAVCYVTKLLNKGPNNISLFNQTDTIGNTSLAHSLAEDQVSLSWTLFSE